MDTKELPVSPFGSHSGVTITFCESGECCGEVELQDHHRNSAGMVHGGVLTTLADVIGGAAVVSQIPRDQYSATTDMTMSFVRAAKSSRLAGKATAYFIGSRMARAEVDVFSDEKLVAKSNLTFMLIPR